MKDRGDILLAQLFPFLHQLHELVCDFILFAGELLQCGNVGCDFGIAHFEVDLFIPLFEGSNLLFAFFQGIFLFAALGFLFLLCLPGKL